MTGMVSYDVTRSFYSALYGFFDDLNERFGGSAETEEIEDHIYRFLNLEGSSLGDKYREWVREEGR